MLSATSRSFILVFATIAALAMSGTALPDVHLRCEEGNKSHWAVVSVEKLTADLPSLLPTSLQLEATAVGDESKCSVSGVSEVTERKTDLTLVFLTDNDRQIKMKIKLNTPLKGKWNCTDVSVYISPQGKGESNGRKVEENWNKVNATELDLGGSSTNGSSCLASKQLPIKTSWGDSSTNSLEITNFKIHPNVEKVPFEGEPNYEEKCTQNDDGGTDGGIAWWGIVLIIISVIVVVGACIGGGYYFVKVRGNQV